MFSTSYDGTVGAMNARPARALWSRKLPYRSLSSATIIGNLLYVADIGEKAQAGQHVRARSGTGTIRWHFNDGEYHGADRRRRPADHLRVTTLYALRPEGGAPVSGQSE